jgi:hypothetical protein
MRTALMMLVAATAAYAQQPANWRLVEEWRVGGEVTGPHSFGDVRGMGLLPNGGIVLFEYKDQQVHFLDARGRPVRTTGRKGSGPGEYSEANGLAVSARGEVVVNDPSNNRLTVLASNGDLVRTIPITNRWGHAYLWDGYFNTSGLLDEYVSVRKPDETETLSARRVWSADYSRIDTLMPPACPGVPRPNPADFSYTFRGERGGMTMGIPHVTPRLGIARTKNGATWVGRYPGYGTIVLTQAGACETAVTIQLRGPRVGVPSVLRDSSVAMVRRNAARYGNPVPDLNKIPREYPSFDALFLDASNRLWVERLAGATARRFEVFSPTGAFLAVVQSPVVFRSYRPVIITNDRVLGFVADEDDVLYLVAFRIDRAQPQR